MCVQVNMAEYTLDKWPAHLRADNYTFTPKANFESPIRFPPHACLWTGGRSQYEPTQTPGEHENTQKKIP